MEIAGLHISDHICLAIKNVLESDGDYTNICDDVQTTLEARNELDPDMCRIAVGLVDVVRVTCSKSSLPRDGLCLYAGALLDRILDFTGGISVMLRDGNATEEETE